MLQLTTDVNSQIEKTLELMENDDFCDIEITVDSIAWQILNQEYGYTILKSQIESQLAQGKKIKNMVTHKMSKLNEFFDLLKKAIVKNAKLIKDDKTFITKDFKIRMSPGAVTVIDEDKVPIEYFTGEGFDMIDMIISNIENDEKAVALGRLNILKRMIGSPNKSMIKEGIKNGKIESKAAIVTKEEIIQSVRVL
jgi:hypothetical protein